MMADILISIDASGVIKGKKIVDQAFEGIASAAAKATSSVDSFQDAINKQSTFTNKSINEAVKLSKKLEELNLAEKAVEKGLRELNSGLLTSTQFTSRYSKAVSVLSADVKNSYGQNLKYANSLDAVSSSLQKARSEEAKNSSVTSAMAGIFKTVKAAALGYATVLATMKVSEFVSNTIKASVVADSLSRSYKAITGSAEAANSELKFISDTANTLGLELTSVEKSYRDIYAASKDTTLEGQGVRDIFSAITKASSVLGMSVDETEGALRALSQMISKSNVQSEELKGQLGGKKLSLSINLLNCGNIFGKFINFLKKGLDYQSNLCYND